jgi:PAS domain-containing protein
MLVEGSGCDVTKRILRPNGEVRYVRSVGFRVIDDGKLKTIVGTAMDVTEQEQMTQELRHREAYLEEAQRLSHTGSFDWNVLNGEINWSDETFRIVEYDRTIKPTLELALRRIHPDDRELVQQVIVRASEARTNLDFEHRLLMPDGFVKYLRKVGRPLGDAPDRLEFVGAVTDITERELAEKKLRRSEEFLLEAQRLSHTGSWRHDVASGEVTVSRKSIESSAAPLMRIPRTQNLGLTGFILRTGKALRNFLKEGKPKELIMKRTIALFFPTEPSSTSKL